VAKPKLNRMNPSTSARLRLNNCRLGSVICILLFSALTAAGNAADRPTCHGFRVPENAIKIDGQSDDWAACLGDLDASATFANDAAHTTFHFDERGSFTGPKDLSLKAWCAVDPENLYVFAEVHDQILINDAGPANAFSGDDLEVFIDANDPASRFAAKTNENVRQLIFVPAFVNPRFKQTFVWHKEQCPGVVAASRLRPWGYTIEIKIPKALFPNWQAHPDLDSIGFDLCANDADASGVDLYHAALKDAMFLLAPAAHFQSPAKLGQLSFDGKPAKALPKVVVPEVSEAEQLLDAIAAPDVARIETALASRDEAGRKAAVEILAKRPELNVPVDALLQMVTPDAKSGYGQLGAPDLLTYALIALAERQQLPVAKLFGTYARVGDPALRLTFIWCCGIQGDQSVAPELAKLLYDGSVRIRMMAAISLAALGARAVLPALQELRDNDPHPYGRGQAEWALKQIQENAN